MRNCININCIKKWLFFLLLCVMAVSSVGCGKEDEHKYTYQIFYVNKAGTKVIPAEYGSNTPKDDVVHLLPELLAQLENITGKPECVPPLAGDIDVIDYVLTEGQLDIEFNEKYLGQTPIMEVLNRAALVRTLTQIEGVNTVAFSVLGAPVTDSLGVPIGAMMADSFIDNTGTGFNAYEKTTLHLYFANETGDQLVEVYRNVVLNNSISMEKMVMDELIKGPDSEGVNMAYPTVNPDTKIQTVTVKDGVCYIDLDKAFLTQPYNITGNVAIYSIVNSMAELPNVNKVQISVEGDTDIIYREDIHLATIFERNLDIVQKAE